jgi:hypothetical protein
MKMCRWRWLLSFLIAILPGSALAQTHGAPSSQSPASPGAPENAEAAALHRGFFADPRSYRLADSRVLIVGLFQPPGSSVAQLRVLDVASGRIA